MNPDFLTSTFVRMRASLRAVAAGIAGNDSADDVLHDAFCRLWSRNKAVMSEIEARRLSYTAVRNMAIDSVRRVSSRPTVPLDEATTFPDNDAATSADDDTYLAVLRISRQSLPPRQYEIFRLHDIDGLTYDEIAQMLSITNENVRMNLCRARKTIRHIYRQQNNDEI